MFTAANWAKLITDEKGRLQVLGVIEALSDPRAFPVLKVLPFLQAQGAAYIANFASASAEAATRALNAEFTEAAPGVDQLTFPLRAAGGQLKIDINMIAGDTTGIMRAALLTQKLKDVGARLFRLFFKGDKDAGSGAEFEGLNNLTGDLTTQIIAGANGALITADLMNQALRMVPGANLIMCNATLADQIDGLNVGVSKQVVLNQGGLSPNMFVQSYKGIPILPVLTAPNDATAVLEEILPFTETQGGSNVCSRVTVARIGLDGIHGRQHKIMELFPARREGAFEYNDLNWMIAPCVTDLKDAAAQVIGVKAS